MTARWRLLGVGEKPSFGITWLPAAMTGLLLGCGDYSGVNQDNDVDSVAGAVVSGAANVSDGLIPNSLAESETAAVGIGAVLAVAYNAPHYSKPGEVCPGYSTVGMSYWNGTWQALRFAPANGAAILFSDPSIGAWDPGGSAYNVYVSTLAYSQTMWNAQPKLSDLCMTIATYQAMPDPDELCVLTVSVPKSGSGAATVTGTRCMTPGGSLDGSALVVSAGIPYAATWNLSNAIHFYRASDGTRLSSPFPTHTIKGHPIFTKNDGAVHMFAPDSGGGFWENTYNASTGAWPTSEIHLQGQFPFTWGDTTLPFDLRGGKEYTAAYQPAPNGPGNYFLFYRDSRGRVVGYGRSSSSMPSWFLAFTSPAGASAFHPSVAVATVPNEFPPFSGFHIALSYWDDSGGAGGSAALKYTNSLSATPATIASETPCPHVRYWGDYDEMAVWNNNTSSSRFYRFFTDSTKSACLADTTNWTTNTPQHVSVTSHAR